MRKKKRPRETALQLTDWQNAEAEGFLSPGYSEINGLANVSGC